MNLTKVFQYSIYPLLMLTTSTVLIAGIERGYNPYWVSLPVIAFTGLLILCLEKLLPYEKQWLNAWDWNLDLTYYIINYLIKVFAQYQFLYLAELINFPVLFPVSWPFWLLRCWGLLYPICQAISLRVCSPYASNSFTLSMR